MDRIRPSQHWFGVEPDASPFIMFFAAVMVAAWFGGLGPGLLATALSTVLSGKSTGGVEPQDVPGLRDRTGRGRRVAFDAFGRDRDRELLRIFQEVLTNVQRHANARN